MAGLARSDPYRLLALVRAMRLGPGPLKDTREDPNRAPQVAVLTRWRPGPLTPASPSSTPPPDLSHPAFRNHLEVS